MGDTCTCGKVRFFDRRSAKRRIRALQGRVGRLHAYRCPDGADCWHIGHLPQRVRNGAVDKDAWLDSKSRARPTPPPPPATFTPTDMARLASRHQETTA